MLDECFPFLVCSSTMSRLELWAALLLAEAVEGPGSVALIPGLLWTNQREERAKGRQRSLEGGRRS